MKIAVLGWYGHNNAGDERIRFCLDSFLKSLGGIEIIDFYDLHNEAINGKTEKFNEYDLVIIGGGGLILSQHNYHDFVLGIKSKLITIGISVETELKGNPRRFAKALLGKSSAILVRDQGSYDQLKSLSHSSNIKLSSDLTFLVPFPVSESSHSEFLGVNLFPKLLNPRFLNFRLLAAHFLKIKYPQPACFQELTQSLQLFYKILPIPLYCENKQNNTPIFQLNDNGFMRKYFHDVPTIFQEGDLDKCKFFFSMRLHGLIFSAQKGIPFLTISAYPKQRNFMREVGLQQYCVDFDKSDQIIQKLSVLNKNFDVTREQILEYRFSAINRVQKDMIDLMNNVLK